jgi:hypothetical protein
MECSITAKNKELKQTNATHKQSIYIHPLYILYAGAYVRLLIHYIDTHIDILLHYSFM